MTLEIKSSRIRVAAEIKNKPEKMWCRAVILNIIAKLRFYPVRTPAQRCLGS